MKKILIVLFCSIFALGFFLIFQESSSAENLKENDSSDDYVADEFIVKFKDDVSLEVQASFNQKNNVQIKKEGRLGFYVMKVPEGKQVKEMVKIYSENPDVEYAEPNYKARISWTPDDPYFSYQWNFDARHINMPAAWNLEKGGNSNVVVAVLDTGIAYENYGAYKKATDFNLTNFVRGYDFINHDTHANDDHGHGTHVAGTIAESTDNGRGAAGIAFNTTLMPVKVLSASGTGTHSNIADGLIYAANQGADVINISIESSSSSNILYNAVKYAYNKGAIIIAAAGNGNMPWREGGDGIQGTGDPVLAWPARYNETIAVGATDYLDHRTYYSNYGSGLSLVAPGGDSSRDFSGDGFPDGIIQQTILSPSTFQYKYKDGTSMAAPHVAGAAALLLAKGYKASEIKKILTSTADKTMAGYNSLEYGSGRLNIAKALAYDSTAPPNVSNFNTSAGNGRVFLSWENPSSLDFSGVKIMRKESGYPQNEKDGQEVYNGSGTRVEDTGLTNGRTYYYCAFSYDDVGNYSSGAKAKVTLSKALIFTAAGPGGGPHVRSFDTSGSASETNFMAYSKSFSGGVRIALGDIDKDGEKEIITGAGPGGGPQVRVFEKDGTVKPIQFFAFHPDFRGGVDVAAGDFDGDGKDEIGVCQFSNGQAWAKVYRYNSEQTVLFYKNVFGSPEVGCTITFGDVDMDGKDEVIIGAGTGGGPHVRVYDKSSSLSGSLKPISFFAFHPDSRTGIDVAAADVDGDGKAEIAACQLASGEAWCKVYRYNDQKTILGEWIAYGQGVETGTNVTLGDTDGDGKAEVVTCPGNGGGPQVRSFEKNGSALSVNFFAYGESFRGGCDVAAY